MVSQFGLENYAIENVEKARNLLIKRQKTRRNKKITRLFSFLKQVKNKL